ncbi:MAG: GDP-mannose 4,6-dehydratase [Verrucomicrobiota bacterium]
MKTLITGITGQDGSYLAEALLARGDEVHGIVRRTSSLDRSRLAHLYGDLTIYNKRLFLHYADLEDITTLRRILARVEPQEFYHLAGQSHVGLSFEIPETTCELTAMGTLRILEMLRDTGPGCRFLHISSSEIFGTPDESPQTETTPMRPLTPYGCAKAFATQMVRIYRDFHGLFACNAIAYNHESPRRGENFVTRKICRAAAEIKLGLRQHLDLGNLEARRDWSDARDIVRGYMAILKHTSPGDFILASGCTYSVREVAEVAFRSLGLEWRDFIRCDESLLRPADPAHLCGDTKKARDELKWRPLSTFSDLIAEMTNAELLQVSPKPEMHHV